jgi:UDP-N-acetylmuramoyl-L-alanyl-D-glutamate--2,6-diaminopimelate ligase
LHIIGITGTNGKTTTSYLIESILRQAKRAVGVIGTISHRYNAHKQKAENTTPGAEDIQWLLKEMGDAKVEFVAMEVSSHAVKQKRVQGVDFDTAIFTNLTHDHLDYHGTIDDYKEAKRLLFKYYLKRSLKAERHAILNLDDKNALDFIPEGSANTSFYILKRGADASLIDLSEEIGGLKLAIDIMGRRLHVNTPLIGPFNASNILAASLSAM